MLDDQELAAARRASTEGERDALLLAAVFACLLRASVLTCAAGYTFGQVVHRHGGPPLVGAFGGRGGFAALVAVGALVWLELALLQTWPRVGLAVTAFWCLASVSAGVWAAVSDSAAWLIPAVVFGVVPLASLLRADVWRLVSLPWLRPTWRRVVEMSVVHVAGAVCVAVVWTGPMTQSVLLGVVLLVVVLGLWLLAALGLVPRWMLRGVPARTGLLVAPQVAIFMAAALFVGGALG